MGFALVNVVVSFQGNGSLLFESRCELAIKTLKQPRIQHSVVRQLWNGHVAYIVCFKIPKQAGVDSWSG